MTRATQLARRAAACAPFVLAGSVGALGAIHLLAGAAVTRLFPVWYAGLPGRAGWPHVAGGALVLLGVLMFSTRWRGRAASAAGWLVVAAVVAQHLPRALGSGEFGDAWLNVFKWLAFAAGVFRLAAPAGDNETRDPGPFARAGGFFARTAPWWLAAFFAGAAVLHGRFAGLIAQYYIPPYLPWRLFWTWFTAGTLAAGAIGLVWPRTRTLAAWLSALMVFLWCPLIHVARVLAAPRDAGEWAGVFESLAFAAVAASIAADVERSAGDSVDD